MTATRDSHLILRSCTKTEVCAFDCADRNNTETDIPVCANTKYGYLNSDRYYYFPPFPLRTKS